LINPEQVYRETGTFHKTFEITYHSKISYLSCFWIFAFIQKSRPCSTRISQECLSTLDLELIWGVWKRLSKMVTLN